MSACNCAPDFDTATALNRRASPFNEACVGVSSADPHWHHSAWIAFAAALMTGGCAPGLISCRLEIARDATIIAVNDGVRRCSIFFVAFCAAAIILVRTSTRADESVLYMYSTARKNEFAATSLRLRFATDATLRAFHMRFGTRTLIGVLHAVKS